MSPIHHKLCTIGVVLFLSNPTMAATEVTTEAITLIFKPAIGLPADTAGAQYACNLPAQNHAFPAFLRAHGLGTQKSVEQALTNIGASRISRRGRRVVTQPFLLAGSSNIWVIASIEVDNRPSVGGATTDIFPAFTIDVGRSYGNGGAVSRAQSNLVEDKFRNALHKEFTRRLNCDRQS